MNIRLSVLSIFLVSSPMLGMEYHKIEDTLIEVNLQSVENECIELDNVITSLQSWQEFAKNNESLDGYDVLPQAVAEFQQRYEIETCHTVLPEVIEAWQNIKNSEAYNLKVLDMHAFIRGGKDNRTNTELAKLKNIYLNKCYHKLGNMEIALMVEQGGLLTKRLLGIFSCSVTVVLFVGCVLEVVYLPCR